MSADHHEPFHGCSDHYCAARDHTGGIRLSGGLGLLVANADHTIGDVVDWFRRSQPGPFREQYRAALRLMYREQGQEDGPVVHDDEIGLADPEPATYAELLGVIPLPVPITEFSKHAAKYPPGATLSQVGSYLWVRDRGATCGGCIACDGRDRAAFERLTGKQSALHVPMGMIVCPACGNKRCPKASSHDNDCSGSNEPGQKGSVYA